ncbi:MAG: DUF4395 family protein [Bacteroidales bacterium]|nr:DUF4395 family protein [Bacteroidales bacterium]
MSIISFGEYIDGKGFKVLDERQMRASGGLMLLLGAIGFVNGFILENYIVIPFITGFLMLNFMIGVLINPKFSPTMAVASYAVRKQKPLHVGAIQKKFAWSLGLGMSIVTFILSLFLLNDPSFFKPVCILCMACLAIIYLEVSFGICIGCKMYYFLIKMKILKEPQERPNCNGDSCEVPAK